jgi:hypothetical protein
VSFTGKDDFMSFGFGIDPNALPAGVTINPTGTQMRFTKAAIEDINGTWLNANPPADRQIGFLGAADQNATTPVIQPTR